MTEQQTLKPLATQEEIKLTRNVNIANGMLVDLDYLSKKYEKVLKNPFIKEVA